MSTAVTYTEQQIRNCLVKLFLAFPSLNKSKGEQLRVYAEALSGIPLRVVEEACSYAIKGKLSGGGQYPPSAGQLYQLAQELLSREYQQTKAERDRRYKEPESKATPEQRAAMIAKFKQLLHDLKTGKPIPVNQAFEPFEPSAKTFSPYRLGMTKEEIIAKVKAYRAGI